jgi:hypothetical protein
MMNKGDNPSGQKKAYTRPKPEKEEVMNTTKTFKIVVMIFAWIVCLQCDAIAGDENIALVKADNGARHYTADVQGKVQTERAPADKTGNDLTLGTVILGNMVTPWGTVPGLITVYSGIGMIVHAVDALVPDKTDKARNNLEIERVAQDKPETKAVADLAANDRN